MQKPISSKRIKVLLDNFNEYSFEGHTPDRSIFNKIANPAELHYIAENYNWDDGPLVLNWIINSPMCDIGTAKLIFWTAAPEFYTQFEKAKDNEYDDGVLDLLKNIMENFESRFYKNEEFACKPSDYDDVDYVNPKAKWIIPDYLKKATEGKKIEFEN